MSVSLYRKYRPETFEAVVGQEHIEKTLTNAVEKDTLSHAYLFCGPRGTGKTTTARLLAKALLCQHAPTAHPDGSCELCHDVANGSHPDVYELDAASNTGVDNIRDAVLASVPYAPTLGKHKLYIIDEVHMLSTGAFNALLKSIEEPPAHVVFVLCTTDPHKVPDTIQSRCQRFDFHQLTNEEIIGHLRYICGKENFEVDERALELIATRSLGGMRDAITALETVAVFGDGAITFEGAESMLGSVSSEQLEALVCHIAARNLPAAFTWVSGFVRTGTDIAQLAKDLAAFVRDIYIVSLINNPADQAAILSIDDDRRARFENVAQGFGSPERLAFVLTVLGDLMTDLKSSLNTRLTLEIALTRLARPQGELTLEALASRIAALENGATFVDVNPSPLSEAQPSVQADALSSAQQLKASDKPPAGVPTKNTPADPAAIRRLWTQVIDGVKSESRMIAALLSGSDAALGASPDKLIIQLPGDGAARKQTLENEDKLALITQALHKLSGRNYSVEYVVDDAVPMRMDAPKPSHFEASSAPPEPQPATTPPASGSNQTDNSTSDPALADILKSSFGEGITIEELPADPALEQPTTASATPSAPQPTTNQLEL